MTMKRIGTIAVSLRMLGPVTPYRPMQRVWAVLGLLV
jgi:hypothetical protein